MRHCPGPRRSPAHRPLLPLLLLGLLLYVLLPPGRSGPGGLSVPGKSVTPTGASTPGRAVVPTGASASLPGADAEVDADGGARSWPLAGRPALLRGWEPPAGPYGPGHRGVDLAAGPGARVLAAADGRVSFAGRVAGRGVLAIEVTESGSPPLRTTYEPVRSLVEKGASVRAGQPVGVLERGRSTTRRAACTGGCDAGTPIWTRSRCCRPDCCGEGLRGCCRCSGCRSHTHPAPPVFEERGPGRSPGSGSGGAFRRRQGRVSRSHRAGPSRRRFPR
ncbi:peptidoglycan DD-metalloendopeptidase family protein [Streptomyces globisporus]|uniref:peptidoglycan DD-metalloendopeptidase family protein n=1 Tax=Streptomyces globisporus TaxID=1908 RepID=UPI0036BE495C